MKDDIILNYVSVNIHPNEYSDTIITNEKLNSLLPQAEILENNISIKEFLENMVIGYEIWFIILIIIIMLVLVEMYISNFYYKN